MDLTTMPCSIASEVTRLHAPTVFFYFGSHEVCCLRDVPRYLSRTKGKHPNTKINAASNCVMYPQYVENTGILRSYSGRKITPRLGCVTARGEGKIERARGSKTAKSLSEHV
jgi:hypothetical protein